MRTIGFFGDKFKLLKPLETIRKNVGRNVFVRLQKFFKALLARKVQITNNQQRSTVTDFVERVRNGASRTFLIHFIFLSKHFFLS